MNKKLKGNFVINIKKIKKIIIRKLISTFISRDYSENDLYDIKMVSKGFENRKINYDNKELIERLIASYNKAKQVQKNMGVAYQVGDEWLPIYKKYMGEIMSALESCDTEKVRTIYNNFFRESCSVGLHGLPVDMKKNYFGKSISNNSKKYFLSDFIHRYEVWNKALGKSFTASDLESPNIGNPYGYFIKGNFVRSGAEYLHYYAEIISRLVRGKHHKIVMELGAGYGGMPYYLMKNNSKITYVDFDLPENLALTAFYLSTAFPDKKIALYGDVDLNEINLKNFDIILMPNFEISKLKENSVDLSFNSYSLAEMPIEAIREYIKHINRITRGFIFHVNHTVDNTTSADDFEIDIEKFELLYRCPAVWNSSRNIQNDEFEYLYKNKKCNLLE